MPALGLTVGSLAPDFLLPDHRGGKVGLSAFRDRQAVLVIFFPFAFTAVCASEFATLDAYIDHFRDSAVQTLAISCDSPYALGQFAEREHIRCDLLSDFWPHGRVSQEYGVFLEDKGFATRGSFLIDRQGRIAWSMVNGPADERIPESYQAAIATLA